MFCKPQDQQQSVTVSKSKCSTLAGARLEPHPRATVPLMLSWLHPAAGTGQRAAEGFPAKGSSCFQQLLHPFAGRKARNGREGREAQTTVPWNNLQVHSSVGSVCFTAFVLPAWLPLAGWPPRPHLCWLAMPGRWLSHCHCRMGGTLPHGRVAP